ncbi:hypothetical protein OUZ56_002779 [Daphnia magna]|uniref:Uncharacterized protein n=1 Tax=Daphnia magna TaxID=35525 RepID=A0ABR0A736_9CRUS|nr:hypothetical protein OUZ56_002779 [Daphnia magna]
MLLCHLGVLLATPRLFQQLYKEGCHGNGSLPWDIGWIVHDLTTVAQFYAALSRSCRDDEHAHVIQISIWLFNSSKKSCVIELQHRLRY